MEGRESERKEKWIEGKVEGKDEVDRQSEKNSEFVYL